MVAGCCIVLLCGLPGVGKSTFALKLIHALSQTNNHKSIETLKKEFSSSSSVIHTIYLCFDDIIPEGLYSDVGMSHDKSLSGNASETAGITWKGYRGKIHEILSLFLDVQSDNKLLYLEKEHSQLLNVLSQSIEMIKPGYVCKCWESAMKGERCDGDARHVIVIDDNMFYSSMRYKYYQLARKYAIGFLEVHLLCDMDVLLRQNSSRSTQVSDDTIRHMSSVFEAPDPHKNKWESNSLKYNTTQDMFEIKQLEVFKLINYCFENPEQPFEEENPAEKETACQVNLTNIIHQADQVIRKVISTEIKRLKGKFAKRINVIELKKKGFFERIKEIKHGFAETGFNDGQQR
ncbi:L-seryl-tRNA(Sec) kinase-like isoform X2 [Rhopilema esculentum]|uniref:L-seryl-tRNA(Sec) kinase-like isoform X2 n=1 Tax=Rhopilema esculentum TaxID=499914 RepID=UPI0031E19EA7